mmetsp:Transcript_42289/g.82744  ORF Transcript_42289/g.82744 Transcript_42289/m.82744 type:complete len:203 (+) Transcript_42289:1139-1747(+)
MECRTRTAHRTHRLSKHIHPLTFAVIPPPRRSQTSMRRRCSTPKRSVTTRRSATTIRPRRCRTTPTITRVVAPSPTIPRITPRLPSAASTILRIPTISRLSPTAVRGVATIGTSSRRRSSSPSLCLGDKVGSASLLGLDHGLRRKQPTGEDMTTPPVKGEERRADSDAAAAIALIHRPIQPIYPIVTCNSSLRNARPPGAVA